MGSETLNLRELIKLRRASRGRWYASGPWIISDSPEPEAAVFIADCTAHTTQTNNGDHARVIAQLVATEHNAIPLLVAEIHKLRQECRKGEPS